MQALEGADILFMAFDSPHETPEEKFDRFMRYLPARAYDNRCFLINCNLTGKGAEGQSFPGTAIALDPKGKLIGRVYGGREYYMLVDFTRSELEGIRNKQKAYFVSQQRKIIRCTNV